MKQNRRKIVIVGSGIAGLCAAVYALKCGYQVEIFEMNEMAGGLATSWRRGPYTFETCLHWLFGSAPHGEMHTQWKEIFDIDKLHFVNPEVFVRMESEDGDALDVYTNINRLEQELLKRAPQDAPAIRDLAHAIHSLGKFRMLDPSGGLQENWLNMLHDLPIYPALRRLSKMSGKEYASHFSDPLLQAFFGGGDMGRMSAIALVFSLAWMNGGNAGYPIGGSQAMIRLIQEEIARLGGKIHFNSKVERILVENGIALGLRLEDHSEVTADWVISAADGHETIFELLGGIYADEKTRDAYETRETFPSYLQVSLGVGMDLSGQPPMATRILGSPLNIDPGTDLDSLSFRIFNFDPTFAPQGKTAVTSFLPTRNFSYWHDLHKNNPAVYREEKHRVAEAVIEVLERMIPGVRAAIETTDVSTPSTVIRYTGNWKGSMEGWLLAPGWSFKPLPNTLPGLDRFLMVGQWVLPGGGLPSGPMTAKPAVKAICKQDGVPFDLHAKEPAIAM